MYKIRIHKCSHFVLQLANANTPIHRWDLPGVPEQFTLSIKRDDLTGSTLSGNKVMTILKYHITLSHIKEIYSRQLY